MKNFMAGSKIYRLTINHLKVKLAGVPDNGKIAAKSKRYFRKEFRYNRKAAKMIDRYENLLREADTQIAQLEAAKVAGNFSEMNDPYDPVSG
jgi:prephenate dehydrogenase